MWTVAELEKELDECGYSGRRMAGAIAASYDLTRPDYIYQTGAKTADRQVLMLAMEVRFLPDRLYGVKALSACFLAERIEQFGLQLHEQQDIWMRFEGLPTIEAVSNALLERELNLNGINDQELYHQNVQDMNLNNLEKLQEELKTLGFSKQIAEAMQRQMEKGVPEFRLHEKKPGDKGQVDLTLYFKQSGQSEHYYFNKYTVALTTAKPLEEGQKYLVITPNEQKPGENLMKPFENVSEAVEFHKEQKGNSVLAAGKDAAHKADLARIENGKNIWVAKDFQNTYRVPAVTQTIFVQNGKGFTAEQSANLIQNRAVFRDDLVKLNGEPYSAWLKLDKDQPKNQYQNFELTQWSVPQYGFILRDTLAKFNVKELENPEKAEKVARALENGNRPLVTVMKEGQIAKLFMEAAPRFGQMNFFREDGKPEKREQFLKEEFREQKVGLGKNVGKEKDQAKEKEMAMGR